MLYLAENHQLALFEVEALLGNPSGPVPNPGTTWVTLELGVTLNSVVDLTQEKERKIIGISLQELTGSWLHYKRTGAAPTQRLGAALFQLADVEAFLVPSAKPVEGRNLVVFPERLQRPASRLEFRNPTTRRIELV